MSYKSVTYYNKFNITCTITSFLLQSALQPLVGFRPAQLSLSILSRQVFTECRLPASEATLANPAAEGETMGEKWPRNFAKSGDFHVTFGFFYVP
jgi:hypothetical protein